MTPMLQDDPFHSQKIHFGFPAGLMNNNWDCFILGFTVTKEGSSFEGVHIQIFYLAFKLKWHKSQIYFLLGVMEAMLYFAMALFL